MQLLSLLLVPLALLGAVVSAADVHTNKPLPTTPQLRYSFCKYRGAFFRRPCAAYMSYRTPNGEQIVKMGEAYWLGCESLMWGKSTNEAGMTTQRSSILGMLFRSKVKLSYKGKSFTAKDNKESYLTDIDQAQDVCSELIFPERKIKQLDTTSWRSTGKRGSRMSGSYQLVYFDVPDILPPQSAGAN